MNKIVAQLHALSVIGVVEAEKNFDPTVTVQFTKDNWSIAIGAVVAYLLLITLGPRIMSTRKEFDIKIPLALWNALLCVFSAMGMLRTVSVKHRH